MATLHLFRQRDGTYHAALLGDGAAGDATDTISAALEDKKSLISRIFIAKGITGIGDGLFKDCLNCKELVFEDASQIAHLGSLAFGYCDVDGSFAFPGLTDTAMSNAFEGCCRLNGVDLTGSAVVELAENAFFKCMALEKVAGLGHVQHVGKQSFCMCPSLTTVDLDKSVVETIGARAFHVSSVDIDFSDWAATEFLDDASNIKGGAVRSEKWDSAVLQELLAVPLMDIDMTPPNLDAQENYPALRYAQTLGRDSKGNVAVKLGYMDKGGCAAFALYHAWQSMHRRDGKAYPNFNAWWEAEVRPEELTDVSDWVSDGRIGAEYLAAETVVKDGNKVYMHIYDFPHGMAEHQCIGEMYRRLGWSRVLGSGYDSNADGAGDATAWAWTSEIKELIKRELEAGRPVCIGFCKSDWRGPEHEAVVVGSTSDGKLIVADSTESSGQVGHVYKVAFEDLFGGDIVPAKNDVTVYRIN